MDSDQALRAQLSRMLEHSQAHTDFGAAVADIAADTRGVRPVGLSHSAWELVEHIRIAQRDILDFCLEAPYRERDWPAQYWPQTPEPPSPEAWDESVATVQRDRAEFQALVADSDVDLFAVVPHGTKQTFLREVLLAADHNSFHLGQLVTVKRLLQG